MTVYEALDIVSQGFADSDEGLTAVKIIADYNKELEGKIVTLDEALAAAHAEKDDALNSYNDLKRRYVISIHAHLTEGDSKNDKFIFL